jgi:hypothetical protein
VRVFSFLGVGNLKKKLLICLTVAAFLVGLRFLDNGLLRIRARGVYTEYGTGTEAVFSEESRPVFASGGYARLDIKGGGLADVLRGLRDLSAGVLWEERLDGIHILYAYSPDISVYEKVLGQKVNVMAVVNGEGAAFGCPLLKGSY